MQTLINEKAVTVEQTDTGNSWNCPNRFKAIARHKLTEDEIKELQTMLGYSPYGYGCYGISHTTCTIYGIHTYTWYCSGTCD